MGPNQSSTGPTQTSATVQITNNTGGNAWILLFHSNSTNGTQSGSWQAAPGETVGPLTVLFEIGWQVGTVLDYWSVLVQIQDGPSAGFYVSRGDEGWTECQLQQKDAGENLTFLLDNHFHIKLPSGSCSCHLTKLSPATQVTNVFVVMLENHSFDNMLAASSIPNLMVAPSDASNEYGGSTYTIQTSAPVSMPTDPGHEFMDVVTQLCGASASWSGDGTYPAIDNSGFAANYATSNSEQTGLPTQDEIGDIMACFATSTQLPILYQLAMEFAVCNYWFSSLPGPTWPNRFFAHGASSSGLDDSPSTTEMAKWETTHHGFKYPNGSIYDALNKAGIPYRFYHDSSGLPLYQSQYSDDPDNGKAVGAIPQVAALKGVTLLDFNSLGTFASDLQGPYPYPYTFIEPHYGDIIDNSYAGGSSQHPKDDVYGGENLLASVYAAIRNSPYWNTSLLLITYDEHGGFYDSVAPGPAPEPGDNPKYGYNQHGFTFNQYGVRVPAIVVSPLIPKQLVDEQVYDHSSIPATLEKLFSLSNLTQRDENAHNVMLMLSLETPRTDCPTSLGSPAPLLKAARIPLTEAERALIEAEPLPESGNLIGALFIMRKTEFELSGQTPTELAAINARFNAIRTRGQAREYIATVMEKVGIAKQQRKLARLRKR